MNKFKRIQCIGCSVLLSLATTVGMAYELPPVEKRNANTTDLSVHNAMFLRQNTQAAVIGILKKNGQNYELAASDGKGGMALPIAVHPSLKIDDALVYLERALNLSPDFYPALVDMTSGLLNLSNDQLKIQKACEYSSLSCT
jgi:hypothetical protein